MEIIIFLVGLIGLIIFSILDIKTLRLNNEFILDYFIVGMALSLFSMNIYPTAIGIGLMALFVYPLWYKEQIGGADAKLLIAIVPFLYLEEIYGLGVITFMISFAIIGTSYGLFIKLKKTKVKEVPLIPIIALCYIFFWASKILI